VRLARPDHDPVQLPDDGRRRHPPRGGQGGQGKKRVREKELKEKELASADQLLAIAKRSGVINKLEAEKKVRVMMPYGEYASICQSLGLSGEETTELASALHTTGKICQLRSDSGKQIIYLRPEILLNSLMGAADPDGHLVEDKKNQLQVLKSDLDSLEQVLGGLQKKAKQNANLKMWGFFGYLTAQTAVLARLTWWEFSWDIMEPITYFITMSGTWFALLYTMITKEEYGHESFHSRMARKKLESLMAKMGISPDKHASIIRRIQEIEADLKSHGYGHLLVQGRAAGPSNPSSPYKPSNPSNPSNPSSPSSAKRENGAPQVLADAAAARDEQRRLSYAELTSAMKHMQEKGDNKKGQ